MLYIYISGQEQKIKADSLVINSAIEERSTASFIVLNDGSTSFQKGQPVLILVDDILIFGGVIENSREKLSRPGYMSHLIQCTDWHYLADKRLAARAYEKETVKTIVEDLLEMYLEDEGITKASIDEGPELEEAVFNYVPVSQCLNALAERTNMIWYIDPYLRLNFVERGVFKSPWIATKADMRFGSVFVESGNPKYRNRQVVKGSRDLTSEQTEIQLGDGEKQTFTVGYPIAHVPSVEVDTGSGFVPKTVGIKGVEGGKDWYWNAGEPSVTQDPSGTPLAASHKIKIKYRGEFPIIVISRSNSEIVRRREIEGIGTGIVEDVRDEPQYSTREAAFQLVAQLLEKYGTIGRMLQFATLRRGLLPGQILSVHLPEYGFDNAELLIESVTIRSRGSSLVWYEVRAIEGPEMHSWTKVFEDIIKLGSFKVREGIGVGEVLIIPYQFSKDWIVSETPNIFYELYPDNGETPGSIYPSFDPAHRVRFLEWHDSGGAVGRKAVTQQSGADTDEIFSLTYMDPADGAGVTVEKFAWIGGIDASLVLGSGVEVDKQSHPEGPTLKTIFQSWQVEKTDRKWS